jgi:hypothetical protein
MAARAFDLSVLLGDIESHRRPRVTTRQLIACVTFCGAVYGAVMGMFGGFAGERALQSLYAAIKVPILILLSFALGLPFFFTITTLLGLRDDFRESVIALLKTQAVVTIALLSMAPYTAVWYCSTTKYEPALLFNAGVFAVASFTGQVRLRALYRPLIARNARHRFMARLWLLLYAFVGIQMGWTLRPFVGDPHSEVHFFRPGAFSNAYQEITRIAWHVATRSSR